MQNIEIEFTTEIPEEIGTFTHEGFSEHALEKIGYSGDVSKWVFAARENNKLIAVISGKNFFGALHIDVLLVNKQYRKKGIGKLLMEKAIEYAKRQNSIFITLCTLNFQALEFYKKFGFEIDFERKGYAKNCSVFFLRKNI